MKKIEAIIRVSKLKAVRDALVAHGTTGMTVTDVFGAGVEKGERIAYRGSETILEFVPRVKLETVAADDDTESVIDAIYQNAYTGEIGDGLILVSNLADVIRIRTGESEAEVEQLAVQ